MVELRALTEVDVEAHNQGEDAEIVRWLTGDWGTEEEIGDRAVARIESGNTASIGVVEKCGFHGIDSRASGSMKADSAISTGEFGTIGTRNGALIYARELRG